MTLVNGTTIGDAIANAVNGLNPMSPANLAILKTYWEPMAAAIMATGAGGFTSYNIVSVACEHGVQASVAHGMPSAPTLAVVLGADGGKSVRGSPVLADLGSGNVGVTLDYDLGATVFTDWVSYTPTGSWTTNTTYTGKWRRVGDTLEAQIHVALSGAPDAVNLDAKIPTTGSIAIDTAKLTSSSSSAVNIGAGTLRISASGAVYIVASHFITTTSVRPVTLLNAASGVQDQFITNLLPVTLASGDFIDFWFRVPIVGWTTGPDATVSSNVTLMLLKQ